MVISLVRPHSGIIAQLGFCFKSCSSPTGKMLLAHRSSSQKAMLLAHSFPWICIKGNKIPYGATHRGLPFCDNVRLHIRSSLLWQRRELEFSYRTSCSLFADVCEWRTNSSPADQCEFTIPIYKLQYFHSKFHSSTENL